MDIRLGGVGVRVSTGDQVDNELVRSISRVRKGISRSNSSSRRA